MNPLVEKAFQHGHLLTTQRGPYREWVVSFLTAQVQEDRKKTDLTAEVLYPNQGVVMRSGIVAKQSGIMAGIEELKLLCELQGISMTPGAMDGAPVKAGEKVADLMGPVGKLLETERVGLELIGRMSGIATGARELVDEIGKIGPVALAATRKTLWGPIDKKAVYLGGGLTHRLGLWQAILIKENHLIGLRNRGEKDPFHEAVYRAAPAVRRGETVFFEVEVESPDDAVTVGDLMTRYIPANSNPHGVPLAVLLDNFSTDQIGETERRFEEKGWKGKILLEASGGITKENVLDFARTGVDLISLGSLTHSARNFDFSQRMVGHPAATADAAPRM